MELVEYYRMRYGLAFYAGFGIIVLLLTYLVGHGDVRVNGGNPFPNSGVAIDLTMVAPVAMFFAAMFATSAALALTRENATLELAWTKPTSRALLALRYIAVDFVAIIIAYAYALVVAIVMMERYGVHPFVTSALALTTALALGVAMMWYALLLAISCRFSLRTAWVVGIAWPVAFAIMGLGINRDGAIGAVLRYLNAIVPFSYLSGMTSGTMSAGVVTGRLTSVWQYAPEIRTAIVWSFTVIFCALAVALWSKREV